ncbi:restriction endonuclease subunit S [Intestinimonas butyriciproducens]|uniref:restriction endonuclease subunit S n=1 Tax=Intestinimonas butyriciproducens TaxID=1297617 RepID=UPI00242F8381
MTKKSDAPAIRFKGFSDAWEQRKFSDITFPAGEKNKDNLPLESYSITNEHGFVPQDEKFENGGTMREADKRMYYIVSPNSFAYNPARINVGSIGYQNIGKNVIVSSLYEVFKTSEDVDDRLLWHWFKSPDFQKLIMQLQEGGVRLYFYYDKLCMGEVSLPLLEEQRKIGKLFDTLDNLITLHQRKFEKLTNVKKSMLEKMFPQNGSSYPEIRFKGFTDPWEQRKAIDIADYSKGNGYSKGDLTDSGTPIILYGRLYTKYQFAISEVDTFAVPRNGAVYSQGNEVIVPASGETAEDIARASAVEESGVLLGGDLNILRPFDFINPLFLALAISNGEPQKELAKKAQGKSVVHIHNTDIQEVTIAYPSRTEQDRIVSVFRQLDNLITLHQRELEKLQNIKKSMLEKMFV